MSIHIPHPTPNTQLHLSMSLLPLAVRPSDDIPGRIKHEGPIDGHCDPPQPGQDQTSQRLSHFSSSDTSNPLFALYIQSAEKLHWRKYDLWKADADQILIFCGLFSAAVSSLTVPLNPNLGDFQKNSENQPLPQPTVNVYLTAVSSLWFWSLFTSIFCATMALSLPRWARPKSMITSPRYSLPEQARLQMFFDDGRKGFNFSHFIQVLTCLVHIAICLFLAGFWLYLDTMAVWTIGLAGYILVFMAYVFFTVSPVLRPGFPCSTPLSPIFAIVYGYVVQGTSRLLYFTTSLIRTRKDTPQGQKNCYRGWNLRKLAEDRAQGLARRLNSEILERTLHVLRSDDDLEQFFDAIPGFVARKLSKSMVLHVSKNQTNRGWQRRLLGSGTVRCHLIWSLNPPKDGGCSSV
ncbi:hypothetical protein BGY98DRAFT_423322 [Russula aff. rugulosa BPL654]|nr:hypothetical protein BGY98DRAFT_423322 [Russula aff. rugulosa BPL654]